MTHAAKRGRALVRPESSPPRRARRARRARRETHFSQLRTVDHSVRGSMKNAANCAKHGELQGFMKPLHVERILRPWLAGQGHTHLRVERNPFSRTSRGARRLPTGRAGLRAGFWLNASAGEAALPFAGWGSAAPPARSPALAGLSLCPTRLEAFGARRARFRPFPCPARGAAEAGRRAGPSDARSEVGHPLQRCATTPPPCRFGDVVGAGDEGAGAKGAAAPSRAFL